MQNGTATEILDVLGEEIIEKMGNTASHFVESNVNDDPNHKSFLLEFLAYEYFWVGIDYDKGRISPFISSGELKIGLFSLRDWWEKMDLSKWIEQLDSELRLRIPDKYLEAKGWNNKSNIVPSSEVNELLNDNVLGGRKIPHRTSQLVILEENGVYYLAVFVTYINKKDIDEGAIERPTTWAIADIESGKIVNVFYSKEKEFSDASYEKKYSVRSDVQFDSSREYYEKCFELLDSVRKEIVLTGKLNTKEYKCYLDKVLANTPTDLQRFYRDLSV